MRRGNRLHDAQPQSRPLILGGIARLKYLLAFFRWDAWTVVFNKKPARVSPNPDGYFLPAVPYRVAEQVLQ